MQATSSAIDVRHLVKTYGSLVAVNDLSFQVKPGSVFAFLGTNGAGKSTTINCIATLLSYDGGTIRINGQLLDKNREKVRHEIGIVFQSSLLDPLLSVKENLQVRAGLYGLSAAQTTSRIVELSKLIGLTEFMDQRYGKLSGGQKRRVDIARSLIHQPSLLILDEPTTGLDPQSRKQVWDTIRTLREARGITVLLTTHYMAETEEADNVLIIDAGAEVAQGAPSVLRAKYSQNILTIITNSFPKLETICASQRVPCIFENNVAKITVTSASQALAILRRHGDAVRDFEFRHGTMDDVFLALTQKRAES
jgi:multidrug/hemolysin transport system ATP-binding protein